MLDVLFQFVDGVSWNVPVQHGVTIRADGAEILDRVHVILLSDGGDLLEVVDVDEVLADRPVGFLEVEATDGAGVSVASKAGGACGGAALVGIHEHLTNAAFRVGGGYGDFFRGVEGLQRGGEKGDVLVQNLSKGYKTVTLEAGVILDVLPQRHHCTRICLIAVISVNPSEEVVRVSGAHGSLVSLSLEHVAQDVDEVESATRIQTEGHKLCLGICGAQLALMDQSADFVGFLVVMLGDFHGYVTGLRNTG